MRCLLILILLNCCILPVHAQVDNSALEQRFFNGDAEASGQGTAAGERAVPGERTSAASEGAAAASEGAATAGERASITGEAAASERAATAGQIGADSVPAVQRKLSLDLLSFNYFRNYEYFNRFADGLTYFGLQLRPQLVFTINENLSLYGGVLLSKDFGRHDFREVAPVLGIRYQKNGISFINGAIDPHLSHGYIEPLFNYDRSITDPVEYGTQLKFDRRRHRTDIWISWENMIYRHSAEQEQILGGVSTDLYLIRDQQQTLSVPIQILGWHQGGQIDTASLPVLTQLNGAAGISYARMWEGGVEKLFTKNYLLGFSSSSDESPYKKGTAFYLNAGLETKWLDAMVSYWQGHQFVAPVGAPVFQSVSSHIDYPGFKQDDRRLLFLRLKKDFTLADELLVSARVEPFWDFDGDYADYSMSLYLVYQGFFDLFKFSAR